MKPFQAFQFFTRQLCSSSSLLAKSARPSNQFTFASTYYRRPRRTSLASGSPKLSEKLTLLSTDRKKKGLDVVKVHDASPSSSSHSQDQKQAAKNKKTARVPAKSVESRRKPSSRQLRYTPIPVETPADIRRNAEMFQLKASHEINYESSLSQFQLSKTQVESDIKLSQVNAFADLPLDSHLLNAVQKLGFGKPTDIQKQTLVRWFNTHPDLLIASETGSGKTLAYLLPVFHDLVKQDKSILATGLHTNKINVIQSLNADGTKNYETNSLAQIRVKDRPRAIVLVPSRSLVNQVTDVAKQLSHLAKLRVVGVHSKMKRRDLRKKLDVPVDILITTPMSLEWLMAPTKSQSQVITASTETKRPILKGKLKRGFGLSLNRCSHVVFDEMDTLFDRDNRKLTTSLISKFKTDSEDVESAKYRCKFIFATATLSNFVSKELSTLVPGHERSMTRSLHKTPHNIKQAFYKLTHSTTKPNFLLDLIKKSVLSGDERILVFCNRTETAVKVASFLKDKNMNCFPCVAGMFDVKTLDTFMSEYMRDPASTPQSDVIEVDMKQQTPRKKLSRQDEQLLKGAHRFTSLKTREPLICVATDLASRGLDTTSTTHVIMYDCPVTPIDYLHRAGRTGRNGEFGKVSSVVTKKDKKIMEWIETRVRKRMSLAE